MAEHACAQCKFRAMYDRNPKSLLGRIWRFHAGFCPGFASYLRSLNEDDRDALARRYHMPKYFRR